MGSLTDRRWLGEATSRLQLAGPVRQLIAGAGAALCAATLLWTAPAQAQDDEMNFGVEEVGEVKDASPVGQFIEEGVKAYDAKQYRQASILFYKVLEEPDISADKFRAKALYELAKTLYRLELYQGALSYFYQIVDAGTEHPYYEATLSWLVLLARKLPGESEILARIGQFAELFPARVPDKFRSEMAFLLGKHFYNEADLDRALEYLKQVDGSSEQFAEAKFLEGICWVRKYEAKPAAAAFKRILAYVSDRDLSDPKLRNIEQLTLLSMGRTFYSVGQYDQAVKYYDFIPQNSPYWLDALFEKSWAYFQQDNFNRSLGNLHTLNAPFFDDEYFPESMILQAVVFFTNCRYDRVRLTIEEFELIYPPLKEQLQETLNQYQDPTELYEFLVKINRGAVEFDPRLNQILDAALTDKTLKRKIEYMEELDRELEAISKSEASWRDSPVGKRLFEDLTVTRSFALADAGGLAQSRMERVVRELGELVKQGKKILVETAKAETNALDQQIRDEQFQGTSSEAAKDVPVDDEHIYWSFQGEYWRDELGYYLYNITSKCGR